MTILRPFTPTCRKLVAIAAVLALLGIAFLTRRTLMPRPERMNPGKFPEQIVYDRTEDDILHGGIIFTPPKDLAKPIAVIWIHGGGVTFYSPTYVAIGRGLAERGYACISGNTRMHDLGLSL